MSNTVGAKDCDEQSVAEAQAEATRDGVAAAHLIRAIILLKDALRSPYPQKSHLDREASAPGQD